MKKFFAILVLVPFLCCSCAAIKTEFASLETKVQAIDWNAALKYWTEFVDGVNKYMPAVKVLLKNNDTTLGKVVNAVNDANTAVSSLKDVVAAYNAGTINEQTVITAAQTVDKAVTDAIAQIQSKGTNPLPQ